MTDQPNQQSEQRCKCCGGEYVNGQPPKFHGVKPFDPNNMMRLIIEPPNQQVEIEAEIEADTKSFELLFRDAIEVPGSYNFDKVRDLHHWYITELARLRTENEHLEIESVNQQYIIVEYEAIQQMFSEDVDTFDVKDRVEALKTKLAEAERERELFRTCNGQIDSALSDLEAALNTKGEVKG